jgi:aminoglycoside phosphotransferase (APT) family kinase protein
MPITLPMHAIARILSQHGLGRHSVVALPGGQINASYLVDDLYVLRVNLRPEERGKLAREMRVLDMVRDQIPVPRTVVYEGSSRIIPHEYMIQTFVPGENLLSRWRLAGTAEQAGYLAQLAAIMKRLHSIRLGGFGDPTNPRAGETWAGVHARRAGHALESARAAANASPALIDEAERALARDGTFLSGGVPALTHGDLHFGNIHVEHGRITGLLDFERSWAAAPDWDLDQLIRFVHYPGVFASSAAEHMVRPRDLAGVLPALQIGYPDLLSTPSLQPRLRVYALEYELRALASARKHHGNNPDAIHAIEARMQDTLSASFPGL